MDLGILSDLGREFCIAVQIKDNRVGKYEKFLFYMKRVY